jgi:hypothetical protein
MSRFDDARMTEGAGVGAALLGHDPIGWRCHTKVAKWHDPTPGIHLVTDPDEIMEIEGNLLMYGGASVQWQTLLGNGGAGALAYFNAANSYIGVGTNGNSSTPNETATATALTTQLARLGMDTNYPAHTDSTAAAGNTCTWRGTADTNTANGQWNEWGIFNAATGGRMLNRKVQALGTKASGSWQLTCTLSLA